MYHGYRCSACNFLFEDKYGERGKQYIEIHHIKPLYMNEKEIPVNPKHDLVPVCSNCHRMIHRKKEDVLSITRLKEIILKNEGKSNDLNY
ncbi:MAG: HNH endonuclease [Clostridiales bacterium]|nr:HNH endonuclease [Clostridiales bacterium]